MPTRKRCVRGFCVFYIERDGAGCLHVHVCCADVVWMCMLNPLADDMTSLPIAATDQPSTFPCSFICMQEANGGGANPDLHFNLAQVRIGVMIFMCCSSYVHCMGWLQGLWVYVAAV